MNLHQIKTYVTEQKAVRDNHSVSIETLKENILDNKKKLKYAEKALWIIQHVAKQTQEKLEYKISELVSLALNSVFDEPYKMVLQYETKRNKTEASLLFERNGKRFNPLSSTGGGVVDVASFALRIAIWNLASKKSRNVIILDEPFKHLSKNLLPKAGEMLQEISKKLILQIIMVSHLEELEPYADKAILVSIKNKISKVKELT
jgi:DNA repair exonuclease SbcCD ATPase subunit